MNGAALQVHLKKRILLPVSSKTSPNSIYLRIPYLRDIQFTRVSFFNIFDRVPYDPYVYFFGEEQSMAIRLYTHGIDLYCPQKTFIYHYYYNPEVNKIKKLHWSDINQKQLDEQKGLARVKYILNMTDHFPDENAIDIGKYSVGNIRSIAEWEAFSGFNLKTGEMTQLALNGLYKDL